MPKLILSTTEREQLHRCLANYLAGLYANKQVGGLEFSAVSEVLSRLRQSNPGQAVSVSEEQASVLVDHACCLPSHALGNQEKLAN